MDNKLTINDDILQNKQNKIYNEEGILLIYVSIKHICGINHVTLYTDDQISSTEAQDACWMSCHARHHDLKSYFHDGGNAKSCIFITVISDFWSPICTEYHSAFFSPEKLNYWKKRGVKI